MSGVPSNMKRFNTPEKRLAMIERLVRARAARKMVDKPLPEPKFSRTQLDFALLETFDLMQRIMLDNKFVVAGEAARCLKEGRWLDCDGIDVVLEKRCVTKEVLSTLKTWATPKITNEGFTWDVNGVPVRVQFVKGIYDYFKFADMRLYGPENYKIPNQFERYWQERSQIA